MLSSTEGLQSQEDDSFCSDVHRDSQHISLTAPRASGIATKPGHPSNQTVKPVLCVKMSGSTVSSNESGPEITYKYTHSKQSHLAGWMNRYKFSLY